MSPVFPFNSWGGGIISFEITYFKFMFRNNIKKFVSLQGFIFLKYFFWFVEADGTSTVVLVAGSG